jgi:invasion protein IalB
MGERQGKQSGFLRTAAMAAFVLVLAAFIADLGIAQQSAPPPSEGKKPEMESRGHRDMIRQIKYGDWQKVCFKTPGSNPVCRTSISGTFDTGQVVVRADLIERQGESKARLQLFVPVGMYLPAGVKATIDQGKPHQIPYVWCLTNTCVAGNPADAALIRELEKGQKLQLEVVDSSVQSITTTLPLGPFASVRQGPPAQTFEQDVDE